MMMRSGFRNFRQRSVYLNARFAIRFLLYLFLFLRGQLVIHDASSMVSNWLRR